AVRSRRRRHAKSDNAAAVNVSLAPLTAAFASDTHWEWNRYASVTQCGSPPRRARVIPHIASLSANPLRLMRSLRLTLPLIALCAPGLLGQTVPAERPSLVVLIAIDQMRPDYFERFRGQFHGGLRTIRDNSAFFPNGHQEHAMTETAPGHSAMLSGREPVHTHIFSNDRGVPDPTVAVLDAPGVMGASPRRFVGTTLYDWMR